MRNYRLFFLNNYRKFDEILLKLPDNFMKFFLKLEETIYFIKILRNFLAI